MLILMPRFASSLWNIILNEDQSNTSKIPYYQVIKSLQSTEPRRNSSSDLLTLEILQQESQQGLLITKIVKQIFSDEEFKQKLSNKPFHRLVCQILTSILLKKYDDLYQDFFLSILYIL